MILKEKSRVLFNVLTLEDSYLDIRNIIQKVKFSCILRKNIVLIVLLL